MQNCRFAILESIHNNLRLFLDFIQLGKQTFNAETKQPVKVFVKEFDGEYPAKDSLGVLDSLPNEIPNDLSIVINAIDEYYK